MGGAELQFHVRKVLSLASAILTATLALAFIAVAINRMRLPYNELGRYYNSGEGVVYHIDDAWAYCVLATILTVAAGLVAWWARRVWRAGS